MSLSLDRREWLLLLLMLGSALLAWHRQFIQDDAFISFQYARNFAEGNGLVWYPGSDEFGYSNFLFTLLVGLLMKCGVDAPAAAMAISLPAYLIVVAVVFSLTETLSPRSLAPYAAAVALAVNYTVSSYATGGLETSLHALLILSAYASAFWYVRKSYPVHPWHIAAAASLALLCRLDSALLLLPLYVYLAMQFFAKRFSWREALMLTLPPVLTVIVFLYGCYVYYGWPLPNTFYAKLLLFRSFDREGWAYLASYLDAEMYYPVLLLAAALLMSKARVGAEIICMWAAVAIWLGYIVHMGGDFMEFRLLVPVLPLFYVGCFSLLSRAALPLAVLAVGVSVYHPYHFRGMLPVTNIPLLNEQVEGWEEVGKALGRLFYTGSPQDVRLAVHTAGAIPYYSRLPTVDIYGLNDRWVAMHGDPGSLIAGHRRMAPFSYLVERKVNLIFPGLPQYICGVSSAAVALPPYHKLPPLLIPLENGCAVVGYYLTPHAAIEASIRSGHILMPGR